MIIIIILVFENDNIGNNIENDSSISKNIDDNNPFPANHRPFPLPFTPFDPFHSIFFCSLICLCSIACICLKVLVINEFIFSYSITCRSSFENLDKWKHEIQYHVGNTAKIVLLGNKADLEDRRQACRNKKP